MSTKYDSRIHRPKEDVWHHIVMPEILEPKRLVDGRLKKDLLVAASARVRFKSVSAKVASSGASISTRFQKLRGISRALNGPSLFRSLVNWSLNFIGQFEFAQTIIFGVTDSKRRKTVFIYECTFHCTTSFTQQSTHISTPHQDTNTSCQ